MSFMWPKLLVAALFGGPLLVAGYVALQRQRAARSAALAAQGFVPARKIGWRRHVPYGLFLVAATLLLAALARPEMNLAVPRREGTVMLAFDVSNSMAASDLAPSRMEAAKAAARLLVEAQPDSIKVGVVSFAKSGFVTQTPTLDRAATVEAIDRLEPQGGTSLGQGLFASLGALTTIGEPPPGTGSAEPASPPPAPSAPVQMDDLDIGYVGSAAIVLFSDGENTDEPDPLDVAELASVAGVKIFTVGVGSPDGTVIEVDGFSLATALDEAALIGIAERSGGAYLAADDEAGLADIHRSIDLKFERKAEPTEVTGVVAAAAALLLAAGGALSLLWFGRVV